MRIPARFETPQRRQDTAYQDATQDAAGYSAKSSHITAPPSTGGRSFGCFSFSSLCASLWVWVSPLSVYRPVVGRYTGEPGRNRPVHPCNLRRLDLTKQAPSIFVPMEAWVYSDRLFEAGPPTGCQSRNSLCQVPPPVVPCPQGESSFLRLLAATPLRTRLERTSPCSPGLYCLMPPDLADILASCHRLPSKPASRRRSVIRY